jgi:hypothetical protein
MMVAAYTNTVKTMVAPCIGGPLAGQLARTDHDLLTLMVPRLGASGI